ncbi:MAG: hypothetical protein M1536_09065 [Firmicutes bacterium]|nr:hypothetical protein [Bacillota bacterium]
MNYFTMTITAFLESLKPHLKWIIITAVAVLIIILITLRVYFRIKNLKKELSTVSQPILEAEEPRGVLVGTPEAEEGGYLVVKKKEEAPDKETEPQKDQTE